MRDFLSLEKQLILAANRFAEIRALLGEVQIINDQNKFKALSKEYSSLEPIINIYQQYKQTEISSKEALAHFKDPDLDVRILAKEEYALLQEKLDQLVEELNILLLPKDPNDEKNVFLEIRAGTGGDEASIFVGDLWRMYNRYAQNCNWDVEVVSSHPSSAGGYKEVIVRIIGDRVYSRLKFESGVHRVQRVPQTEAQGRVHTSTCTIAVLPEVESIEEIKIDGKDLRIDTYRSSGAGGQHVNKTDSAIRITHLPSGLVVECQEERSQIKNRAKAMSLLQARLLAQARTSQEKEQALTRKSLVGSGERCERIRTYNYSQGRVTDHRINLSLYKLPSIMEGDISEIIDALSRVEQSELLANLSL